MSQAALSKKNVTISNSNQRGAQLIVIDELTTLPSMMPAPYRQWHMPRTPSVPILACEMKYCNVQVALDVGFISEDKRRKNKHLCQHKHQKCIKSRSNRTRPSSHHSLGAGNIMTTE